MSSQYKATSQNTLIELENEQGRTGRITQSSDVDAEAFKAIRAESNARKSEAIVIQDETSLLLKVQALLFRGRIEQAEHLIKKSLESESDRTVIGELMLEQARLRAFQGRWGEVIELTDLALKNSPIAISRLTLLQVRALAHFELQNMTQSMRDLDLAESMSVLFPHSPSALFSKLQKIKITARDEGPRAAKLRLAILIQEMSDINPEILLSILRVELDIIRQANLPILNHAIACYALSILTGDKLYGGLALLDCAQSVSNEIRPYFTQLLKNEVQEFEQIRNLKDEVESGEPKTSSGAALIHTTKINPTSLQSNGRNSKLPSTLSKFLDNPLCFDIIILKNHELVATLKPYKISSLKNQKQIFKACHVLASGPLTKEEFFCQVWNLKKYASRLHDTLIWSLLRRIKKLTGLQVSILNGHVTANPFLILESL